MDKFDEQAARLVQMLLDEAEGMRPADYAPWRECDYRELAEPIAAALRHAAELEPRQANR